MALQYNIGTPGSPTSGTGLWSFLGNVQIGPDTSGNFVLTPGGLAVRRNDGTCVAVDGEHDALLDVTALVLNGVDPGVIRLPLPLDAVHRGDLIISNDFPFSLLFVLATEGEVGMFCLDPLTGEFVSYTPAINPFLRTVVVAVSIYDLLIKGGRHEDEDEERRHSGGLRDILLPLILLGSFGQGIFGAAGATSTTTTTAPAAPPTSGAPGLPLLLSALALGEGGGLGGLFGERRGREEDEERRHGGLRDILLPLILLGSFGQGIFGAAAGASTTTTTAPAAPPTSGALGLPLLPLVLAIGEGGGLGGFFGERQGREEDEERRHHGGLRDILLPLILLGSFGQGIFGAAGGTSTIATASTTPPSSGVAGLANNFPLLLLAGALGGRHGLGEFFGQS